MLTLVALILHIILCRQSSISIASMMHYTLHEIYKEYINVR